MPELTPANQFEVATPADYAQTFQSFKPGAKVLEDLLGRFHDRDIWVAGGVDGQRETERRAAQKEVVGFILRQIGLNGGSQ